MRRVWLSCCVALASSGCFFSLEEPPSRSSKSDVTLIEQHATWRFLDTGNAPSGWTTLAFDDSSWPEGPAELGYGDGDESQVVAYGPDENAKYASFYCRHHFVLAEALAFSSLHVEIVRDDGVVVYLNGDELFRDNMPSGPTSPDMLSLSPVFDDAEATPVTANLPAAGLMAGDNVLAAEVHQDDPTSSDTSFSLVLTAR